jgi:hypothetical protein
MTSVIHGCGAAGYGSNRKEVNGMGLTIAGIMAVGLAFVVIPIFVTSYQRLRGPRVVICPETREPTVVEFDQARSAMSATLGSKHLHLGTCARWPARAGCDQRCIRNVKPAMAEFHGVLLPERG